MKVIRFVAVGALLALAACSKPAATDKPADVAATPAKPPLVTVNGKPISEKLYEEYAQALARKPASELSPPKIVSRSRRTWCASSSSRSRPRKTAWPRIPMSPRASSWRRLEVLQQAAAQKYLKDHTPTEAELRAEFEAQIASAPLVEYQARHILVSSEDVAQKIIEQLKAGNDFATLAKRLSSRQGNPRRRAAISAGSDPATWIPQFTNAVALLKKGEFTATPVQTQSGWHVIQLQNTRDRTPPAYDDVKDRLAQIVVAKRFKAHSDEMLKTAKIDPPLTTVPRAPRRLPRRRRPRAAPPGSDH